MAPKKRTIPLAEKMKSPVGIGSRHLSFFLSTDIEHPISPFISMFFVIPKYGSFTSASLGWCQQREKIGWQEQHNRLGQTIFIFCCPSSIFTDIGEWLENQILIPDWPHFHCPGATLVPHLFQLHSEVIFFCPGIFFFFPFCFGLFF